MNVIFLWHATKSAASSLLLDLPCQDDAATSAVDDVSTYNNDPAFSLGFSEDFSTTGPGLSFTAAFNGNAMDTAGSVISLDSELLFDETDTATIEFFAKRHSVDGGISIYDSGAAAYIGFADTTHDISIADANAFIDTLATGVDTTDWHHYAVTLEADGEIYLYVDGSLVGLVGTRTDTIGVNSLLFQKTDFCGVKVYNEVRTQPQIQADSDEGISGGGGGGTIPVFVHHYRMQGAA